MCDRHGKEVTIFVYKDGKVKCTGVASLSAADKKNAGPNCSAETCQQIAEYKSKLDAEEQVG
jgi:TATA-box binding protein (TBP) (component of TFIID and TFIIIB)